MTDADLGASEASNHGKGKVKYLKFVDSDDRRGRHLESVGWGQSFRSKAPS